MSVNKVILLGNVGPERAYRKRSGEEVPEKTEWHNIVAWQGVAERVERQLHRGSFVYLEGKLRSRQWIDQSNVRHYITEIFVDQFELLKNPSNANNNANESSSPADDAGNPA